MRIIHDNIILLKSMTNELTTRLSDHRVSPLGKRRKDEESDKNDYYLPDTNIILGEGAWVNSFFGNIEEQEEMSNESVSLPLDGKSEKSFHLRGSDQLIEDTDSVKVDHDDHTHSVENEPLDM